MRSHHHNPGGSQNQGNSLGDRSSVRQSKLYRVHESGNVMKGLVGTPHLAWRVDQKEGAYSGQPVYDHDAGATTHRVSREPASPEAKARLRAQRLHAELVRANPDPDPPRRGADVRGPPGRARPGPVGEEERVERDAREEAFWRRELARMDDRDRDGSGEDGRARGYGGTHRHVDFDGGGGYSDRDARGGEREWEREREWEERERRREGARDVGPSEEDLGALQRKIGELESLERAMRLREEIRALEAIRMQLPVLRGRTTTSAAAYLPPYPVPSQSQLHSPTHGLGQSLSPQRPPPHAHAHAQSPPLAEAPLSRSNPAVHSRAPPFALDPAPAALTASTYSSTFSGSHPAAAAAAVGASAREQRAKEHLRDTRPW